MYNAGLILEGGGMKGVYTAGVLDFFIDKNIMFSSVYGVSAGACNMASYIAGQKERGRDVMIDYIGEKRYLGLYSLLTTGDIFGVDMIYDLVPRYLNPIDSLKYSEYTGKAYAVTTNIVTGEAEYHQVKDVMGDVQYIRASSSLPLVSKNVKIGDGIYLDGGIVDSIPIRKSEQDGNVKNVVVLTKAEGYTRKPESKRNLALLKTRYVKYPKVYEMMKCRHQVYNDDLHYVEEKEKAGDLIVIRPSVDMQIGRIEKDVDKLMELYRLGYEDAKKAYDRMVEYLNN